MSDSQAKVRALLDERLYAWNEARSGPLDIVWQNTPGTPAETHLRPYLLPAGVSSDDLEGKHRRYTGVYQVNIVSPVATGPGLAEAIADELADLFPVNLRLIGEITVQVMTPVSPGPALQESHAWTLPVSFTVRSDSIL